jgi:hypothetical protein
LIVPGQILDTTSVSSKNTFLPSSVTAGEEKLGQNIVGGDVHWLLPEAP